MKNRTGSHRRGFTLIEIMTVVVILGILGAIVIPRFTHATDDAIESTVRAQLQHVRTAIELYQARHLGEVPQELLELVKDDYLNALPKHPGTLEYQYDAQTGDFRSPLNLDW